MQKPQPKMNLCNRKFDWNIHRNYLRLNDIFSTCFSRGALRVHLPPETRPNCFSETFSTRQKGKLRFGAFFAPSVKSNIDYIYTAYNCCGVGLFLGSLCQGTKIQCPSLPCILRVIHSATQEAIETVTI